MRLTTVILIATLMQVSASSFSQKITFSVKNGSLKQLFSEIKKQTGYNVLWNAETLNTAKSINVNFVNSELEYVLKTSLSNQSLSYTIEKNTIVIKHKEDLPFVDIDVRGRILDERGQGLSGATVKVKGDSKTAITNANGEFTLQKVDENATIVISFLGYKTMELSAAKDLGVIKLLADIGSLAEISVTINTGYQSISRERSAGAFAKPDKEVFSNRSTTMNVIQRLEGLVPGLTINNGPGGGGLLIRGLTSINSSRTPLVVVDGVSISDISSINPQDVDDVTVLKDATAASIYGARASNGVIVITTKRGAASEKLRINYDGFLSFQGKPDLGYQPVLTSQEYIQAARDVFDPVAYPWNTVSASPLAISSFGVPPHEMILYNQSRGLITQAQANKSLDSLAGLNNIGQIKDLWYRNASLMNHTLSLTGGGKVHSIYGSLAYTDAQSDRPGATNKAYKINLRQDFNIANFLKAYLVTDLTNSISSSPRQVSVTNRFYPYQMFQDASGNNVSMPYVGPFTDATRADVAARSRIGMDYKPLEDEELANSTSNSLLNRITGGVTVNLVKGLRYEGLGGYMRGHNKSTLYDDNTSFVQRNELVQFTVAASPTVIPVYYLPVAGGKYFTGNDIQRNWTLRNQLVYDQSFKDGKHQLTALFGQEAQDQLLTTNESTVRGYNRQLRSGIAIDYAALSLGIQNPIAINNSGRSVLPADFYFEREGQTRFNSYYANGAYTFARKYSLNASWRSDKSNLFGMEKGAQNRPVWSVGAKWMIGDEAFAKNISFINRLALRATYGITGNAPDPGTASSFNILSSVTSASLPGGRYFAIATPGNPQLSWESTETMNFGLDFSVLNSRLSASVDYYRKKTDGLIGQLGVNSLTGYSTITGNFGNLTNNGIEGTINSINVNARDFKWTTQLNFAYNKNKITRFKLAAPVTTGAQMVGQTYFPGYSAFSIFAYQYAGLDVMGDPMITLADQTSTKSRNISLPKDILYMGSSQPPLSGGLSNNFTYKGFSLGFNAIFNLGHKMRRDVGNYFTGRLVGSNALVLNAGRYTSAINLNQGNVNAIFNERWKQSGDEKNTNVPAYVSNTSLSGSRRDISYFTSGDINVLDASYIKMRDITLAYSLSNNIVKAIRANSVTLRMQLSNIMLWKANKYGVDPEFGGGIRSMQGIVTAGAHISF